MDRNKNLEDLKEDKRYDPDLIDDLINGRMESLNSIPMDQRNSKDFMIPLLYAVKRRFNTYEKVFAICGPAIQMDPAVAIDVLKAEPHLIEKTDLCKDPNFIKDVVTSCPGIIQYISPELKKEPEFVKDIERETGIIMAVEEVAESVGDIIESFMSQLETNPSLANDEMFITDAVKHDASFILKASKELKNDFDFIKKSALENEEVISLIANNVDEFEVEGIRAAREVSRDSALKDCETSIIEMIGKLADAKLDDTKTEKEKEDFEKEKAKFEKVKRTIDIARAKGEKDFGPDYVDPHVMKWATAMIARMDEPPADLLRKLTEYSVLGMEQMQREIAENGDAAITLEAAQGLITPTIMNKLLASAAKQGIVFEPEMQARLNGYEKFHQNFSGRFAELKKEKFLSEHPEYADKISAKTKDEHDVINPIPNIPFEELQENMNAVSKKEIDETQNAVIRGAKESAEPDKNNKVMDGPAELIEI